MTKLFHSVTRDPSTQSWDGHRAESVTVTPGSVLNLSQVSKSTVRRWEQRGWIEDRGLYVLTVAGYKS